MAYILPEPSHIFDLTAHDGAVLRLRRHGNPAGPRIALCHGNGLATDAYYPFWERLCGRYDVIIFDMRNHGQNPTHTLEGHCWANFAQDLAEIADALDSEYGRKPTVAAFHSLSAIASVRQALGGAARWAAMVLFDPPLCPPEGHALHAAHRRDMDELSSRSYRRPERYRDLGLFELQLRAGREFKHWLPGMHKLMAACTLRPDPAAGDFVLACPREFEAKVFETNIDPTHWPRLGEIDIPLHIIGADPEVEVTRAPARLAAAMAEEFDLPYARIPGTTHFLQIEKPEPAVAAFEDFLDDLGLSA